jgi:PAS domain S-box-containing protein
MKVKRSIRKKIIFFISLATLLVVVIGFLIGYSSGANLLKKTIGRDYEQIAGTLAANVQQMVEKEISCLEGSVMLTILSKNALKESNAQYQEMDPADIQKFMADMDKQWIEAEKDSPLVKRYLETDLGLVLRDKCKINKGIAELFISDRFGGLVAASDKTSDFYQADEDWWQNAFAQGKGEASVEDIEFDESSNTLAMTFAIPIRDDNGSVIGIIKAVMDIQFLFSLLENFEFGHSGHAALVDKRGYVIAHEGIKPLSRKLFSDDEFQKLLHSKNRSMIIDKQAIHPERVFVSFAEVKYHLFLKRGMVWRVIVGQETKEVFWPLYFFIIQVIGLTVLLIILIPIFGFIFGSRIARPIEKLKEASGHISKGELDYSIKVETGDELEELADSFRNMSSSIKGRENQLINQKVYSQGIIASMSDALLVINSDATLRSANKAALDLLGYQEDELIGQPIKKIFLQGEERVLHHHFKRIIDAGVAYNIGLNFLTKQGRIIPVSFNGAVMRQEGKVIGIVGVARDMRQTMKIISDLDKQRRELEDRSKNLTQMQKAMLHIMGDLKDSKDGMEKALRAKTEFTGMVSHELRTPLAAIKEGVSVVLDKILGNINEEQQKYLSIAKKNVDRLDRLINGVLDLQVLESGKMEFKMEEHDINKIVREIRREMLPLVKKKNLRFTCQLDRNLPRTQFDRDKIIQVLTNLVNNALKFTEKGGITLTTRKRNNLIQVTVKDTGPGIKEEDMAKIFQQYTQLQRKVGGTGLGLSICRQIIEAHKGKIWVESEFGKGTTFYFTIPVGKKKIGEILIEEGKISDEDLKRALEKQKKG